MLRVSCVAQYSEPNQKLAFLRATMLANDCALQLPRGRRRMKTYGTGTHMQGTEQIQYCKVQDQT